MTKTIFEEMGGTYRQVGDYLLPNITVPAEEEIEPIGLWGKRHARHLKEHYKVLYMNLLTSGKLHSYLAEVDKQAEDMFLRLVKEYADRQDVTEQLKKDNPYEWIGRMNNIQACVREVVGTELIYRQSSGSDRTIFSGNYFKRSIIYFRTDPGRSSYRRDCRRYH